MVTSFNPFSGGKSSHLPPFQGSFTSQPVSISWSNFGGAGLTTNYTAQGRPEDEQRTISDRNWPSISTSRFSRRKKSNFLCSFWNTPSLLNQRLKFCVLLVCTSLYIGVHAKKFLPIILTPLESNIFDNLPQLNPRDPSQQ